MNFASVADFEVGADVDPALRGPRIRIPTPLRQAYGAFVQSQRCLMGWEFIERGLVIGNVLSTTP
jgi:hypothetical protein